MTVKAEAVWTLIAPDGRQWTGDTAMKAHLAELQSRIPNEIILKRIFDENEANKREEREALEAARREGMEEAAKICDKENDDWKILRDIAMKGADEYGKIHAVVSMLSSSRCAAAIRARIEQTSTAKPT